VEIKEYLKGSEFIPTDGKVKEVALGIIKGKRVLLRRQGLFMIGSLIIPSGT